MACFRVLLRGRNFWLSIDGRVERLGFYATRFVDAADEHDAEARALDLLREDPTLLGTRNDHSDPPEIFIEEVHEVDPVDVPETVEGYTFFPDEKDADA